MERYIMDTHDPRSSPAHTYETVRLYEPPRTGRGPTRPMRWFKRAISAGLLVATTVMGVQLGLGAPDVSPVSPAAIAEVVAQLAGGAVGTTPPPNGAAGAAQLPPVANAGTAQLPAVDAAQLPAGGAAPLTEGADSTPQFPSSGTDDPAPLTKGANVGRALPDEHRSGHHRGGRP